MAEKSRLKLMIYAILVVIILLGLIGIITILGGKAFYLELIGFLFLLLLSLIGLIGYTTSWGERVLFFVFLFYLLNLVLVWYFTGLLYLILLFLAVVGMLLSFPKKSFPLREGRVAEVESTYKIETSEPHSEVFDLPLEEVKIEEPVIKSVKSKTKAKHSPGKLVASKNSNIYHLPKCEWAKKIKRHRRIWFKSKEEAWEQGYRAHNCIK